MLVAAAVFGSLGSAHAVLTTLSYTPNPIDLNDLDHHMVYTWRLDSLPKETITSATLTFKNIANWDANTNKIFGHLLDTARNAGVASFVDDPTNSSPVTDITDDFVSTRYHSDPSWLVAAGTADTKLFGKSFTTTASTYVYTFTSSDLAALTSYIANGGDIAFGFDPDCHYYNDGITFTMTYNGAAPGPSPIPEVSALLPLAGILGLAIGVQAWFRRRSEEAIA